MTFALDLAAFAKKTDAKLEVAVKNIVLGVAKELVEMSPVGDSETWAANIERADRGLPPLPAGYVGGRFKNSWDYGFNAPPSAMYRDIDPSGSGSLSRIEAGMGGKMAGVHYIVNNTPYAMALEEGHSHLQAPNGMVELTMMKWQTIVDEAAGELV